jgi:hypothetical protein
MMRENSRKVVKEIEMWKRGKEMKKIMTNKDTKGDVE